MVRFGSEEVVMNVLFPLGPWIIRLYEKVAPEKYRTERALTWIAIGTVLLHLFVYGMLLYILIRMFS
jgi:hypothetical protein